MKTIKLVFPILIITLLISNFSSFAFPPKKSSVLIFSLTKGFRHGSIKYGVAAIKKLGEQNGFDVDATEDAAQINSQNLNKYKTLIFLSPTGTNVFSDEQKAALKAYINKGGGLVGIHAATDFCYEWEWYGKMIGGYFDSHPAVQKAKLVIEKPKDKLLKGLPLDWTHKDEWYNFKNVNPDITILVKLDETSYKGGNMKNNHPMTWYHKFEGGRVFYTGMGHSDETFSDPNFLGLLMNGISWTMK